MGSVLRHLGIRQQLLFVLSIFMIPLAVLTWLLVAQSNKDIDFSSKEAMGSQYLRPITLLLIELAGRRAPESLMAVSAQERTYGGLFETSGLYDDMATALQDIKGGSDPVGRAAAMTAVRALVSRVGDSSNLILDPDLDSYYAMDVLVVRMPEVVDRAAGLRVMSAASLGKESLTLAEMGDFLAAKGAFAAAVDAVESDLASGYRGNPDGTMKAALASPQKAFRDAYTRYAEVMARTPVAGGDGKVDESDLESAYMAMLAASKALWVADTNELDRLLAIRIGGFQQKLVISLGIAGVATMLAFALALVVARALNRSILTLQGAMSQLAQGNHGLLIPFTDNRNELGAMARGVEVFRQAMSANEKMQAEREEEHRHNVRMMEEAATLQAAHQREQEHRLQVMAEQARLQEEREREQLAQLARSQRLQQATSQFDDRVGDLVATLASATTELHATAENMSSIAVETTNRASLVFSASEEAAGNVAAVAAAAEQLTASIQEIGRQVTMSSKITGEATDLSRQAKAVVVGLSESSKKIGEVVELIAKIASQTNLLALNATIEAARAGDAGKGFAVVANEVKTLATQTRQATDDITGQIRAIQSEASSAVGAITKISQVIEDVSHVADAITTAVGEQDLATREIAENIVQASSGTQRVSQNIQDVTHAASETGAASEQVLAASNDLAGQSNQLQHLVMQFLQAVRA